MADNSFHDIELEDLLEWMESGGGKISQELSDYAMMLEKIWGMYRRHLDFPNEESIINYLVQIHKMQRFQARKLVNDSLSYFSADLQHSKQTWINLIVDLMKKNYIFAISLAKNTNDAVKSNAILKDMADILDLKTADIMEMEEDLMKQVQILTTDITMFGEEKVSRVDLGNLIDNLPDVPEKIKEAVKMDIDNFPFKLLKPGNNPRNND